MNEDEIALARSAAEGTAAGLTRSFHELVVRLGGPAATELGAAWGDQVRVWRIGRATRLKKRLDDLIGAQAVTRTIPAKALLPSIEYATLEDDDFLQDRWAALMASAITGESDCGLTGPFAEILRQLTVGDVELLDALYSATLTPDPIPSSDRMYHCFGEYLAVRDIFYARCARPAEFRFDLLLSNVVRLGILRIQDSSQLAFDVTNPTAEYCFTPIGVALIEACRVGGKPNP